MIGLDTNVLVRYLAQDDPEQSAQATELIESLTEDDQGFVSKVAVVELYWVLRSAYKTDRATAARIIAKLTDSDEIVVEQRDLVRQALAALDGSLDFPDALIVALGRAAGCSHTVTFDQHAAQLEGMSLLDGTE